MEGAERFSSSSGDVVQVEDDAMVEAIKETNDGVIEGANVNVFYDKEREVLCYVYFYDRGGEAANGGMSCLPAEETNYSAD